MSLICGSLTWLEDHEQNEKVKLEQDLKVLDQASEKEVPSNNTTNNEPTWFTAAKKIISNSQKRDKIKEELKRIHQQEEKIQKLKERVKMNSAKTDNSSNLPTIERKMKRSQNVEEPDEQDVLIDDIESDEESVIEEPCEEMVL